MGTNEEHNNYIKLEELKTRMDLLEKNILTKEKLKELDSLIDYKNRTEWFWSSLRTWILAISSTIALLTVGLDGLKAILRKLVS